MMTKKVWKNFREWGSRVDILRKKRRKIHGPSSRKTDYSRLTNADLKNICKLLRVKTEELRWNAKKKKLFIKEELAYSGSMEISSLKKKAQEVLNA